MREMRQERRKLEISGKISHKHGQNKGWKW